ncbi:hypothetical protein LSH36_281g05049 [Paralvinella palmiformis]|uniref:Uncharacterized protein n=1 Tax=Paralvinella palmiformis TaxID=53620 RepID=A0AAD9JJ28_9ANNE|nr:hypothetical protein LSH36_281g05049 [Paralvinella palmiformis]
MFLLNAKYIGILLLIVACLSLYIVDNWRGLILEDGDTNNNTVSSLSETRQVEDVYDKSNFSEPDNEMFPRTIDFNAPCDVSAVLTSLHDPSVPLTTSLLSKLRGCAILLFFRTPRSGTTVFYYLLEKLGQSLGYKASLMRPIKRGDIQEFWVSYVNEMTTNQSLIALGVHQQAIDLVKKPIKSAIVINLIREPIEHLVSIFKMKKYGDRTETGYVKDTFGKCNISFSDYVLQNGLDYPCLKDRYTGLRFLCGNCTNCQSRKNCLEEAKNNVDSLYLSVGVSENIPAFLLVLETLLPQFFYGALDTYVKMSGLYQMFTPDVYRNETVTPEVMSYLKKELSSDIELYRFVQEKLYLVVRKVLEYRANRDLEDSRLLRNRITEQNI